jgi:DNA-binding transcriptional LysR family regulator
MSKLEQIATFIAVVEANSFAAAARKRGVSAAAISRQLANLESSLGVHLLQRTTRQLLLTDIGKQYYQQCKNTLRALNEAEDLIADSHKEATGILHVISNRYFASNHLLPRLPEFMAANPKLRVHFELAERFPDLAKENIDILFGVSIEGPAELVRKRVATTRYKFCASPAYLKKYGIPKTPADLTKHRYITHSIRKPNNILTFTNDIQIQLEPVLLLNDASAMCECAIQGMGIVKLHDYMVNTALQKGQLVEVLTAFREPEISIYLYYQQSRYLQPKIRKFIDFYTRS